MAESRWDGDTTSHSCDLSQKLFNSVRLHRQFNTLSSLLHSPAALLNSFHNASTPSREASCTILWSAV